MKRCLGCQEEKPLSAYYKMKAGKLGLEARCKDCVRERKRAYCRAHAEEMRQRYKVKYLQNADNRRRQAREYRRKNKLKSEARWKVKDALRRGKLVRPEVCSECGDKGARIEAHHHDYSKPLDVHWLCSGCHADLGVRLREVMPNEGHS